MKNYIPLAVCLCFASVVFAETVRLKDGREVVGKIVEKTASRVKMDVNGTAITYYADEIKDVDGVSLTEPAGNVTTMPAAPAGGDNKRELILKFIDVFGTRTAMTQNLDAMLKTLPADDPEAKKLKENIKVNEIIERLIPIYEKQFSAQDLNIFIDFYSSPAGRNLVAGIPVIMKDSIEISGRYFQEKFPELKEDKK